MGFWENSWRVFQGVTSLGGTERIRYYEQKYKGLWQQYTRLCSLIDAGNIELFEEAKRLNFYVRDARKTLKRAARLLRQCHTTPDQQDYSNGASLAPSSRLTMQTSQPGSDLANVTLAGVAAGTAFAASAWGIVQVIGHASTGTAMAGLHGIAAWNAGWAWFGGGSLAAGGGGMAAGHLVLPGIGTAVAVAVSSYLSHAEANKLASACEEVEAANDKNQKALGVLNAHTRTVQTLQEKVILEHRALSEHVNQIYARILPFGLLSHLVRLIIAVFTGNYFKPHEYQLVQQLEAAVNSFLDAFS